MNCDPQALIAASREFCCIPNGMQRSVIISLLCEWANNITPPVPLFSWEPESEIVQWTDSAGAHLGDLAAFYATPTWPSTTIIDSTFTNVTSFQNVSSLTSLTTLLINDGHLVGNADFSNCLNLVTVDCSNQNGLLTGVDFTGCTSLSVVDCSVNATLATLTFTGCMALTDVDCSLCGLTSLDVSGNTLLINLNCSDNPPLTTLTLTGCTGLQTVSGMNCTSLQTVLGAGVVNVAVGGNGVEFDNCPALVTFDFPDLTNIDEDLHCPACANIPLLATVGGEVLVEDGSVNSSFSAPSLTSIGALASGWFKCRNTTKVTSVSVPVLNDVGNDMDFTNSVNIASITATLLNSISNQFILTGCTSLTSLLFPALQVVGAGAAIDGIAGLTSWSAATLIFATNTWSWNGDGLDSTSIAQILARAVASGLILGTIDISGGTNAAYGTWTPQAQADLLTLTTAGVTVNYNP